MKKREKHRNLPEFLPHLKKRGKGDLLYRNLRDRGRKGGNFSSTSG